MLNSCLTSNREKGIFEFPKFSVRRSNRLFGLPRTERSIVAYSAAEVVAVFRWSAFTYWQGATSGIREDQRLHREPGSVAPAFFIIPNLCEVPMFRFFLFRSLQQLQYRSLSLRPKLFIMGGAA